MADTSSLPELLIDVLDGMDESIVIHDADGRYLYINTTAEKMMGRSRAELLGRLWREVFPEALGTPFHQSLQRVAQGGPAETLEHYYPSWQRWYDNRVFRTAQGRVCVVARDITERKQAEQREAAARADADMQRTVLQNIFNQAPISICLQRGPEHVYTLTNPLYRRLLGNREMLGKPVRQALPDFAGQGFFELLDRVYQTGEPFVGREMSATFDRHGTGQMEEGFFNFVYQPMRDIHGQVDGILTVAYEVTDHVRARQKAEALAAELVVREARMRRIVESNLAGIFFWNMTGAVTLTNDAFLHMLGYTREDMESGRVDWRKLTPADYNERDAVQAELVVRAGAHPPYEKEYFHRDGHRVPVLIVSAIFQDTSQEGVSFVLDLTERRRAEDNLRFLAEVSEALASSIDYATTISSVARVAVPRFADWCCVFIREGEQGTPRLLAANHRDAVRAERLREMYLRYPLSELAPHGPGRVLHTGRGELLPRVTDEVLRSIAQGPEHLGWLRELMTQSTLVVPLTVSGNTFGAIAFGTTPSGRIYGPEDQRVAEEVARRASVAIENARLFHLAQSERRRAEEANRLKDEFLATMSHELRTPLTSMLGWVQMLRSGIVAEEKRGRALETIERNARAQAQLIEDLLDVSRILTGKMRLDVVTLELSDVVTAALDSVRPAAEAKGIRLQPVLDTNIGPLLGDPHRLQQVVWNLLSNAVKFTPKGGRIHVSLRREHSAALITIQDTGQGISPDFLPYVFERFRQAEASTTRKHGGLGLGLSIVKHLVEMHGGTVEAYSEGEGKGTSFTVHLPVSPLRTEPAPLETSAGSMPVPGFECPPGIQGLRVLVVDDEEDVRELMVAMLDRCKVRVRTVKSASEALEALRRERFDVLVSDVGMPEEDGYMLIRQVRQLPLEQNGRIPALAMTAYARVEDRTRALLAGYQMHLPKPIVPSELLVTLTSLAQRG
ncbi:PAS domain-containing hybrid sensor histidine kinase/response regulator [Archangium sp.]|uniref:PAS domain-containing hybrid sensor histidine kinase/response regulator n=1 Tax=Archangium sp. TaxID=1872627 RepID=UPI002D5B63EA|nr:ATP-binding protein [Archangium sp.]HYO52650.1 ATP-binding protein [Archangium sp.]